MNRVEMLMRKAGIEPERVGKRHKYYRVKGRLYTVSYGKHADDRSRTHALLRILQEIIRRG